MKKFKFKLKSGVTNFKNIRWAPVLNCAVKYKSKILIVKRSKSMRLYPGYWNGISGFLDDRKSLEEKVYEELREELRIGRRDIISITIGKIFDQEAPKYEKTWIVHPVLVKIKTNRIKLDWEAEDYKWIKPREANSFKLLPGFDLVLRNLSLT